MKSLAKLLLFASLAFLSFSCSTENMDDAAEPFLINLSAPEVKDIEVEILELINEHRKSLNLNPLSMMTTVKSVAYTHTDYMLEKDQMSHDNFYKRSKYLKTNVGASKVSENVAYGYSSARTVVDAWLKSESHKKNIEGDFSYFDISAEQSIEGKWYYTNIFIKK